MKGIKTFVWATMLLGITIPAIAAERQFDAQSAKVDYSDLDLTQTHGVSTLESRVSRAVRQVCGSPAFDLQQKMDQRACLRSSANSASSQVDKAIATAKQAPIRPATTAPIRRFGSSVLAGTQQPPISHAPFSRR